MVSIYPTLCVAFTCLAGACPSTCCSGWQIRIDESAYQHFLGMSGTLSQDILSHIEKKGSTLCFKNQAGGRCSMLDADGLCRIQKNASEADLCNTCRKFPRLQGNVQGQNWLSMASSCPVIAHTLWAEEVKWICQDESGRQTLLNQEDIPVLREGRKQYQEALETIWRRRNLHQTHLSHTQAAHQIQRGRFALVFDVVEMWSDLLLAFPERPYLKGSFDVFDNPCWEEEDLCQRMTQMDQLISKDWEHFLGQYIPYRIFTDQLEHPDNAVTLSTRLALGECALIYTILFSRLQSGITYSETCILEIIDWVYRFCAHGEKMYQKIVEISLEKFQEICAFVEIIQIFV